MHAHCQQLSSHKFSYAVINISHCHLELLYNREYEHVHVYMFAYVSLKNFYIVLEERRCSFDTVFRI